MIGVGWRNISLTLVDKDCFTFGKFFTLLIILSYWIYSLYDFDSMWYITLRLKWFRGLLFKPPHIFNNSISRLYKCAPFFSLDLLQQLWKAVRFSEKSFLSLYLMVSVAASPSPFFGTSFSHQLSDMKLIGHIMQCL
jgi:hypothetical protein